MRGRRGVTLIELLVAITLFSFLSAAVLMSLRTGLSSLDRLRERVASSRREQGAERAIELMLAGAMRMDVQYQQPGISGLTTANFFQGDLQTMRFVTIHSLEQSSRGVPQLVELTVVPREQRDGVRLVMNERPYPGPIGAGMLIGGSFPNPGGQGNTLQFLPVSIGPRTFILADNLQTCRFFYMERLQYDEVRWNAKWPHAYLPRAIRVEMNPRQTVTSVIHVQQQEF